MNRNVMYNYLKSVGLYGIFRWKDGNKSYHTEFTTEYGQTCDVIFSFGYIRNVKSIHLCSNEMVFEGMNDMKINVYYKDIEDDKFEVRINRD